MGGQNIYYPTTFVQRKIMMRISKTHNISFSFKKAKVHINAFRRWVPRCLEQGIEGIRNPIKHIRKMVFPR